MIHQYYYHRHYGYVYHKQDTENLEKSTLIPPSATTSKRLNYNDMFSLTLIYDSGKLAMRLYW